MITADLAFAGWLSRRFDVEIPIPLILRGGGDFRRTVATRCLMESKGRENHGRMRKQEKKKKRLSLMNTNLSSKIS